MSGHPQRPSSLPIPEGSYQITIRRIPDYYLRTRLARNNGINLLHLCGAACRPCHASPSLAPVEVSFDTLEEYPIQEEENHDVEVLRSYDRMMPMLGRWISLPNLSIHVEPSDVSLPRHNSEPLLSQC